MMRVVIFIILLIPASALAQLNKGETNLTTIILHPPISQELKLDAKQRESIGRLVELSKRPPTGLREIQEFDEKVTELLSPKQAKRAKQLLLQTNI